MTARILDLRIVLTRDGHIRASIDGHIVPITSTPDLSVALADLALRIEACAWATQRAQLDVATDPTSAVYQAHR